jgi:hypothetical protein
MARPGLEPGHNGFQKGVTSASAAASVEDCECLGALEAGRGADVTVGDRTRRGEVEDDVSEFGAAELQAGGWPNDAAQPSMGRQLAVAFQK